MILAINPTNSQCDLARPAKAIEGTSPRQRLSQPLKAFALRARGEKGRLHNDSHKAQHFFDRF